MLRMGRTPTSWPAWPRGVNRSSASRQTMVSPFFSLFLILIEIWIFFSVILIDYLLSRSDVWMKTLTLTLTLNFLANAIQLLVELASLQTSFVTLDEVIKTTNRWPAPTTLYISFFGSNIIPSYWFITVCTGRPSKKAHSADPNLTACIWKCKSNFLMAFFTWWKKS